ncbi:hypothetical protein HJA87_31110, partial [Rhizobium bangladeshense]
MKRVLTISFLLSAVLVNSAPMASGKDAEMTLTFVARGPQAPVQGHAVSFFGHAYVIIGVPTNFGVKEEILGFYPTKGLGIIKSPGMLKAEYRCGPNDDCNPRYQRQLLLRLSESKASVKIPITSTERETFYNTVREWGQNSSAVQYTPVTPKEYDLAFQNCIDFIATVLKDLNYKVPERSALQTPTEFLTELKPLIETQLEARERQAEIKKLGRALQEAEDRAEAEREARKAAEAERDEAIKQVESLKQRKKESEKIPAGWVKCDCPTIHAGLGRIIKGRRYHPEVTCHCEFPPGWIRVRPIKGRTNEEAEIYGRADYCSAEGAGGRR